MAAGAVAGGLTAKLLATSALVAAATLSLPAVMTAAASAAMVAISNVASTFVDKFLERRDETDDGKAPIGEAPRILPHTSKREYDRDPSTGNIEKTISVPDSANPGEFIPVTAVVLHQSQTSSGLKGLVFDAGNVGVGRELSGLDQLGI